MTISNKEKDERCVSTDDVDEMAFEALLVGIYSGDYETDEPSDPIAYFEWERDVMTLSKRFLIRGLDHACATHLEQIDLSHYESKKIDRVTTENKWGQCMALIPEICQNLREQSAVDRIAVKVKAYIAYVMEYAASEEVLKSCPGKSHHPQCITRYSPGTADIHSRRGQLLISSPHCSMYID